MVRGCVCVAEWLELGQAPGYECGCCSMVLCGPAVAVCRVEGPGKVQSAHTSGRPSAGPYSLGVSFCWPRTLNRAVTRGGGGYLILIGRSGRGLFNFKFEKENRGGGLFYFE